MPLDKTVISYSESKTALYASSFFAVCVLPLGKVIVMFFAALIILLFSSLAVSVGLYDNINAATPETKGAANDVPFSVVYPLFSVVVEITLPGAYISTFVPLEL